MAIPTQVACPFGRISLQPLAFKPNVSSLAWSNTTPDGPAELGHDAHHAFLEETIDEGSTFASTHDPDRSRLVHGRSRVSPKGRLADTRGVRSVKQSSSSATSVHLSRLFNPLTSEGFVANLVT